MSVELYEDKFEVQSSARLVVKNIRGSVKVVPGESGEIMVKAEKVLNDGSINDLALEVYQEGDTVYAVARYPDRFRIFGNFWPCKVHFEITAPVDTSLNIKTVSAAVKAEGFNADVRVKSVSGSQLVSDLTGELDLESVSGDIAGQNLNGNAEVSTVSGRIRLNQSNFSALRAKTVSGKLEVQTALEAGPYDMSSVSGSIKLVTDKDASCDVRASGVSGRFYTDLGVRSSDIGNRSWRVKVGKGEANVRMKTVSGRMSLVSSFGASGSHPSEKHMSQEERIGVLDKLSEGELSVEEALKEIS